MKIVIASDGFLKMIAGQIGGFRDRGHEVLLLCRDNAVGFGRNPQERRELVDSIGVETIELPGRRLGPETFPAVAEARRQVRKWQPDIVLGHENLDPRLAWTVKGFPLAYLIHDPTPHPGAPRDRLSLRLASRAWHRQADRFVVHSELLVDELPEAIHRGKPIAVVPHGAVVRPEPLPVPERPNVLLFGRLVQYKGVGELVKAMRIVWETRPDVKLTIAGGGPAAAEVPDDPRIDLRAGYLPESEVEPLFRSATVSVLPYTQASQSGVGLQSLSMGLPTVVTDVGALPDLAEKPSRLVPHSSPEPLARAIIEALDCSEADRRATLEFARERFSWPSVADQYVQLFGTMLEQKSHG